jgi:hypothetical protein
MSIRYVFLSSIVALLLLWSCFRSDAYDKFRPKYNPAGQVQQWSFDKDTKGGLPAEAQVFSGKWAVRAETDAPSPQHALCQTGTARFPALTLSDKIYTDVSVSTRFKPISGNEDRAAGIIFRVQDNDNFYILRANALEDNVNIYKYAAGSRHDLKDGSAKVVSGQWQELRVEVKADRIRGYLNGKLVVEARDETFKAGKIGLWTKADSVTCFDDVKATAQ